MKGASVMKKVLKDIEKLLCDVIEDVYNKGSVTPTDVEMMNKAVETIKHIEEICNLGNYEEGYSGCNYSRYNSGYSGYSNNRGRYSSYNRNYDRKYSGEDETSHMIEKLEDIMDSTTNNHDREIIKSCINKLS